MASMLHPPRKTVLNTASTDLSHAPHTPQKDGRAGLWITWRGKAARDRLFKKVAGRCAENPWIISHAYTKCLIMEQILCRNWSRIPRNWVFLPRVWSFLPHAVFAPFFFSLSLNIRKERRKEALKGQKRTHPRSTGFANWSKSDPRVLPPSTPNSVETRGSGFIACSTTYRRIRHHPRIHGLHAPGYHWASKPTLFVHSKLWISIKLSRRHNAE